MYVSEDGERPDFSDESQLVWSVHNVAYGDWTHNGQVLTDVEV